MGFLQNFGAKTKKRASREVENWRAPRTMGGQNISLVEAAYYALVLLLALLLAGLSQKAPMGQILVFGAAVVALSAHVRREAIPFLYDAVAPRFGWAPFSEAIQQELAAEPGAAAVQPAAVPQAAPVAVQEPAVAAVVQEPAAPEAPTNQAQVAPQAEAPPQAEPAKASEVLRVFAGLPQADRRARSLQVIDFLKKAGRDLTSLDQVQDEQERKIVAEFTLMDLARKEGLA